MKLLFLFLLIELGFPPLCIGSTFKKCIKRSNIDESKGGLSLGERTLIDESTKDMMYIYDSHDHGLGIIATVDRNKSLSTVIHAKNARGRSPIIRGSELFAKAIKYFDGRFKSILGAWTDGSNLDKFNQLIKNKVSAEEAAKATWTGQQAKKYGYTDVKILELEGSERSGYTKVRVVFMKPF